MNRIHSQGHLQPHLHTLYTCTWKKIPVGGLCTCVFTISDLEGGVTLKALAADTGICSNIESTLLWIHDKDVTHVQTTCSITLFLRVISLGLLKQKNPMQ